MNRLVKIVIMLGLVWSLYWYGAGFLLREGIKGWFQAQEAWGWQAEYSGIESSGYPLRHFTTLQNPALADPASGIAWAADWLHLDSPAIWPGRQTLHFASTPQRLSYFDRTLVIEARDMMAALYLRPGLALELDRMALTSGPVQISADSGPLVSADDLTVAMAQAGQPETYQFDIQVGGFAPGKGVRGLIRAGDALPGSFETLALDMAVRFDRPWDRRALEERRPQPVAIDLKLAELRWGDLRVMGAGQITVDAGGLPSGTLDIKAENWRELLAALSATGTIPQQALDPVARMLGLLSGLSGNPNALDVQLTLRNGQVAFGPIPLGPAPRLILR